MEISPGFSSPLLYSAGVASLMIPHSQHVQLAQGYGWVAWVSSCIVTELKLFLHRLDCPSLEPILFISFLCGISVLCCLVSKV